MNADASPKYWDYCYKVINIKHYFFSECNKSGLIKLYEIQKIWSRWLITHLSRRTANEPKMVGNADEHRSIIVTCIDIHDDQELLLELQKSGSMPNTVYKTLHKMFISMIDTTLKDYDLTPMIVDGKFSVNTTGDESTVTWTNHEESLSVKINKDKYSRLKRDYVGPADDLLIHIWKLVWQYTILDGNSLQWAVPSYVLKQFNGMITDLRGELFASPTNRFMTEYFSLFPTDQMFGATANFFNMDKDYLMMGGTYIVNPPFIEEFFIKSSRIIIDEMIRAFKLNIALTMIYIMPNWLDSKGYNALKESYFFRGEKVLLKREHSYYESASDSYVYNGAFNTHILVLSTEQKTGIDLQRIKWGTDPTNDI